MSLAQDIRNAFDWRDSDAMDRALRRVRDLEVQAQTPLRTAEHCDNPRGCVCQYVRHPEPQHCRYFKP